MAANLNTPVLSLTATGDIRPSRFVSMSTAADFTAAESNAGDWVVGVSQVGTRDAPGLSGAGTDAAQTGESFHAFANGQIAWLECGTTITRADLLKPDNDGKAIVGTAGVYYGAQALESGVTGDLIYVIVTIGELET